MSSFFYLVNMSNKSNTLVIASELRKLKKMMTHLCIDEHVELTAVRTIKHLEDALAELSDETVELVSDEDDK